MHSYLSLPRLTASVFASFCLVCSTGVFAKTEQTKSIVLQAAAGETLEIGTLELTEVDGRFDAKVVLDDTKFGEFFLSMRPFKCIDLPEQQLCHLPYPYENPGVIDNEDLVDLEYQLLFIRRQPNDYGINPWHGVYYKLNWNEPSAGDLTGELFEVDLDILAAPPEAGNLRPITTDELYEADSSQHIFPSIRIQ